MTDMLDIANKLVDGARAALPGLTPTPPAQEIRMSVAGDREALVRDALTALNEAEGSEARWRDTAAQRRLELGRALMAARGCWPARGPKAKGWGELLARVELEERTARRYMQLAGYVDEVSDTESEMSDGAAASVPTYAEAGIDKRAVAPEPVTSPDDSPPATQPSRPAAGAATVAPSASVRTADGGEHAASVDEGPEPDRDTWCTPQWLAEAVGPFDVDPCTNDRSHIRATKKLQLERGEDGLAMAKFFPAEKRVWCNPPYSRGQVPRWIAAYQHTRFAFLLRFDSSTRWFCELFILSEAIAVPKLRRVNFEPPPGVADPGVRFPHGLFYAREADITPELRALCLIWRITDEDRAEVARHLETLKKKDIA